MSLKIKKRSIFINTMKPVIVNKLKLKHCRQCPNDVIEKEIMAVFPLLHRKDCINWVDRIIDALLPYCVPFNAEKEA